MTCNTNHLNERCESCGHRKGKHGAWHHGCPNVENKLEGFAEPLPFLTDQHFKPSGQYINEE